MRLPGREVHVERYSGRSVRVELRFDRGEEGEGGENSEYPG